jgi:hypothetical protein
MYVAGLHIPFDPSPSQLSECIVWSTLFLSHARLIKQQRQAFVKADKEGGSIARSPYTLAGRLVTPVHAVATVFMPFAYILAMPLLVFRQPQWLEKWALPDGGLSAHQKVVLRIGAGLVVCAVTETSGRVIRQLGRSFHAISVRPYRPKNVTVILKTITTGTRETQDC